MLSARHLSTRSVNISEGQRLLIEGVLDSCVRFELRRAVWQQYVYLCGRPTMKLTPDEVRHVAALARLGLTDEEVIRMGDQLSSILEHIAVLDRVDTSSIHPTAQVTALSNVMREDIVAPSLSQEAVLANAPRRREGFFEVDAVLGATAEEISA